MPIPLERFALLSLCREKIKPNGFLLWHNYRGVSNHPDKLNPEKAFIDGYLGGGPNYTFYTEFDRDQTMEILYSTGFAHNDNINLRKISANTGAYSFVFNSGQDNLIANTLDLQKMIKLEQDGKQVIVTPEEMPVLELYRRELRTTPKGNENAKQRNIDAHKYHLLASRIFYEIFRDQLCQPNIEQEINEGRGRIDIVYRNKNQEGIFKDLKDLRDIMCPDIMVECKNYVNNARIMLTI